MHIKRPAQELEVGINMTPIIDMVFLLLIFFLVATKFADIERDVRVMPPSSRHARPVTATPRELVVNVTQAGRVLVAGNDMDLAGLDDLLARTLAQNPKQVVVVRGDRQAVLQYAVDVLDLCEKRGVSRTFLTTSQTSPP
ncbi:MAG: biopolymer transporter ExbD [Verrucomicrobia bacterium]|nr:biopolymer transporter ExbD [Verrucomicrobiota bacterium]